MKSYMPNPSPTKNDAVQGVDNVDTPSVVSTFVHGKQDKRGLVDILGFVHLSTFGRKVAAAPGLKE
jgi:hypothetical protein